MSIHKISLVFVINILVFISAGPARAIPILDLPSGNTAITGSDLTAGWEFSVISPINVDALGFYDHESNGLINSHDVGLWDNGRTLLVKTTITTGSYTVPSTTGTGSWIFNSIAPLVLPPGDYVLGATFMERDEDHSIAFEASVTTVPQIIWNEDRTGPNLPTGELTYPGFSFPDFSFGTNAGNFGPNMNVIPEPGTSILLAAGLVGLAGIRRKLTV